MKKLLTFVAIAVVVMAAVDASAQVRVYAGGAFGGSLYWDDVNSWSDDLATSAGAVPDATIDAAILNLWGGPATVRDANAAAKSVQLGLYANPGDLAVTADGTLTVATHMLLASDAAEVVTVVNDGTITLGAPAYFRAGQATMVNNGTFTAPTLILGEEATADSELTNTGTMNINGWLYLSNLGLNSAFNMDGGTVSADAFVNSAGGSGHLQLDGGTMTFGSWGLDGTGAYTVDITEGSIIVTDAFDGGGWDYITGEGFVTAYGGAGTVVRDFNAGTGETTLYAVIPEPATLSLVALLGGGMLWFRKRFMI